MSYGPVSRLYKPSSVKIAELVITQTMLNGSQATLVFLKSMMLGKFHRDHPDCSAECTLR